MLGGRRANLDLANKLYSCPIKIEFIQMDENSIGQLMYALKRLKYEVEIYYEHDQRLMEETKLFIKVCSKVVSTLSDYSIYFKEINTVIVKYFTLTKKTIYIDLYKENVEPIIELIKVLRKQQDNAYIKNLLELIKENHISTENCYILTKGKLLDKYIEIEDVKYKVMQDKEFLNLGVFAETVIFLGTPSYFDRKFSKVFYGEKNIFLGYSCFENRLLKRKAFSDLINHDHLINTVYNDIIVDEGFLGLDFKEAFTMKNEERSEESLINRFENLITPPFLEKLEAKIATISQKNYIFLPIKQKVNVIDRDSLKISQEKVKDLSIGDLLIFREHDASSLVREEADKIMGSNARKYRESLGKWKKRLNFNVNKKGIEKVSRILKVRYGISIAKEKNIRNWMSNHSIRPSCLGDLLEAFKFSQHEQNEILNAADEIRSAHISAGHYISRALMKELDGNLENMVNENGSYSFESKEFEGAFFHIEEIKRISNETYSIPENETLKIIKG